MIEAKRGFPLEREEAVARERRLEHRRRNLLEKFSRLPSAILENGTENDISRFETDTDAAQTYRDISRFETERRWATDISASTAALEFRFLIIGVDILFVSNN
ncbi:hypothetical protein CEXT_701891 [Caerostris extrusa]|uniref:IBB domain-containing protein n=1 Tax=Caerostris extrusa TaxID=172846 RepID=A0AAV4VJU4_CAEEX|nr:hypothetical protein CEXT_701891 [Caerostris extrusa]